MMTPEPNIGRACRAGCLALVCMATGRPLMAQAVATSFEQLQVLVAPGATVTVIDSTGAETRGTISGLSASSLSLGADGKLLDFGERDVAAIRARRSDPLGNGALWGLGIGAGLPLVAFAVACGGGSDCDGEVGALIFAAALAYGGIGAGIGVGIDALIKGDHVVYQRPAGAARRITVAPLLTRRQVGVAVSVGF